MSAASNVSTGLSTGSLDLVQRPEGTSVQKYLRAAVLIAAPALLVHVYALRAPVCLSAKYSIRSSASSTRAFPTSYAVSCSAPSSSRTSMNVNVSLVSPNATGELIDGDTTTRPTPPVPFQVPASQYLTAADNVEGTHLQGCYQKSTRHQHLTVVVACAASLL